jgi:hypothetical protein
MIRKVETALEAFTPDERARCIVCKVPIDPIKTFVGFIRVARAP